MLQTVIKRLRSWAIFIGLCVALAFLVKAYVLSGYTIPTDSMEPTLYGDRSRGDRVAVFKLHYRFFDPQRFDLVVFSIEKERLEEPGLGVSPDPGRVEMVKRIVGCAGESIMLRDGDIFLGEQVPRLYRKSLAQMKRQLIPVYRSAFDASFAADWEPLTVRSPEVKVDTEAWSRGWQVEGGACFCRGTRRELAGRDVGLTFKRELEDGYFDEEGRYRPGSFTVRDVALTLECELLGGQGYLFGQIREGADCFTFELNTSEGSEEGRGGGRLIHNFGDPIVRTIEPDLFRGLQPGQQVKIVFLNIDNQVMLICDERVLIHYAYDDNTPFHSASLFNRPTFGTCGLDVRFDAVDIDRDIHYTELGRFARGEPYTIPPDSFFVLGDNSSISGDSRNFGPISRDRIGGRPLLVFYPPDRIRFL